MFRRNMLTMKMIGKHNNSSSIVLLMCDGGEWSTLLALNPPLPLLSLSLSHSYSLPLFSHPGTFSLLIMLTLKILVLKNGLSTKTILMKLQSSPPIPSLKEFLVTGMTLSSLSSTSALLEDRSSSSIAPWTTGKYRGVDEVEGDSSTYHSKKPPLPLAETSRLQRSLTSKNLAFKKDLLLQTLASIPPLWLYQRVPDLKVYRQTSRIFKSGATISAPLEESRPISSVPVKTGKIYIW